MKFDHIQHCRNIAIKVLI